MPAGYLVQFWVNDSRIKLDALAVEAACEPGLNAEVAGGFVEETVLALDSDASESV